MATETQGGTSTDGAGTAPGGTATTEAKPAEETILGGGASGATAQTQQAGQGTTEPQKDGAKPDEKAVAKPPADVELKLPEGVKADEKLLGGFKAWAKETGLKSEQAQKLADFFFSSQQEAAKAQQTALEQQRVQVTQEWVQAIKSDKELGGQAFEKTTADVRKAVGKFFSPEARELFNKTGLGNHPELVRGFARIGKALGEDSLAGTKDGPSAAQSDSELVKSLYPNTPEFHQ